MLSIVNRCSKMMANATLESKIAKRITLHEVDKGIEEYKANMTAGKYLVLPWKNAEDMTDQ